MSVSALRTYTPADVGRDGYPAAWHDLKHQVRAAADHRCVRCGHPYVVGQSGSFQEADELHPRRTEREVGFSQAALDLAFEERAEELGDTTGSRRTNWSPCDRRCTHGGPVRLRAGSRWGILDQLAPGVTAGSLVAHQVEAAWRILTVHHLDGDKLNCRWWNLTALCQRCHLEIQGRVVMDRRWPHEHSDWFKPYAAGYYAFRYLGAELDRQAVEARLEELLALEHRQLELNA